MQRTVFKKGKNEKAYNQKKKDNVKTAKKRQK